MSSEHCNHGWDDGWSTEHRCRRLIGHEGDHTCRCDAFQSQWVAKNGMEFAIESAEEARLRLREELRKLQSQGTNIVPW